MADGEFRLKGKVVWKYTVTLKTGLHIGGASSIYEIGAPDSPVIKHPVTGEPYIPGSSVKGKLRSLLERKYVNWEPVIEAKLQGKLDDLEEKGFAVHNKRDPKKSVVILQDCKKYMESFGNTVDEDVSFICKLFGVPSNVDSAEPTRLIVTDALLVDGSKETEIKCENALDRITSAANPRFIERVPDGVQFEGYLIFNVYTDDDSKLVEKLKEAFELLARDYLGGHGSRGYGRVRIEISSPEFYPASFFEDSKTRGAFEVLKGVYDLDGQNEKGGQ